METIQTTTKYGGSAKEARDGFKISATATLTPEQIVTQAGKGLASDLYRAGASALNKDLGVENNSMTEFSDARARQIEKFLPEWARENLGFDMAVTVSRHVHGEGVEPKYADEKKIVARHIEKKDVVTWAVDVIGFTGGGELDTENVELLKAVKAYKTKLLASA